MSDAWSIVKLPELVDIRIGRTPPRKQSKYWTPDLSYPFCSITDMPKNSWNVSPKREGVTELAERDGKAKRVPAGSLLMSFKLTIGRIGFAAVDLFPNEAIAWLQPKLDSVDVRYLAYYLEAQDLSQGAGRAVKGNTLNKDSMAAIDITLPPLATQRRIVAVIDSIDKQIAALDAERDAGRALVLSIADKVWETEGISGAVLADQFQIFDCEHKTAPASNEDSAGFSIGTGDIRLGGIWTISAKQVTSKTMALWTSRATPKAGDLVFTREAPVGEVGRVSEVTEPICLGQRTVLVRPVDGSDSELLWAALLSPTGQQWLKERSIGQTVQRVNLKALKEFPLPVEGAKSVVTGIDALWRHCGDIERELLVIRATRSAVLNALLSREIEIPESFDELLSEKIAV